ncbi:MAG: hypothetical protein IPG86_18295 [Chitinophagaceae bacterium]|jgi:hypothetical protein|nr:hypothetical protein [Chitinophagaceae bacterium]
MMKPVSSSLVLLCLTLILSSCSFNCQIGNDTAEEKTKPRVKDEMLLYNGIELTTRNMRVGKAYLVTNDGQAERIDDDNVVDLEKGVKLILLIKEGWKEINDRVWLDASLLVTNSSGETVLEKENMFAKYGEEGLSAADAKIIGLSVYFKGENTARPDTYHVSFKISDQKGEASLEGSYKLYTR